jgi:glycine cleavage system H protein
MSERRFTKDHEWLLADGANYLVGITDYAQKELGDIVFAELPAVGVELKEGDAFATVESVKAVSEVYSPVDAVVIEVNEKLVNAPELINSSPNEEGWIAKIKLTNTDQLTGLMDETAYQAYLSEISK